MTIDMLAFNHQHVRNLSWILTAPPLMSRSVFDFKLPQLSVDWLFHLDADPIKLETHLAKRKSMLLGGYYESLWAFYLSEHPGMTLHAHSLQVFAENTTIGEFDFIYSNTSNNQFVHLEVAIKFYLGCVSSDPSQASQLCQWIGPGKKDRLDKKVDKLINHQSQLSQTEAGKLSINNLGIDRVDRQVCLSGYLFHPFKAQIELPDEVNLQHNQGIWLAQNALEEFLSSPLNNSRLYNSLSYWGIWNKPDWLAPQLKSRTELLSNQQLKGYIQQHFLNSGKPILLSEFVVAESLSVFPMLTPLYVSSKPMFIVPNNWLSGIPAER